MARISTPQMPITQSPLKRVGYDGWVSIEDGLNGMEDMRRSLRFLEGMRAKHFG